MLATRRNAPVARTSRRAHPNGGSHATAERSTMAPAPPLSEPTSRYAHAARRLADGAHCYVPLLAHARRYMPLRACWATIDPKRSNIEPSSERVDCIALTCNGSDSGSGSGSGSGEERRLHRAHLLLSMLRRARRPEGRQLIGRRRRVRLGATARAEGRVPARERRHVDRVVVRSRRRRRETAAHPTAAHPAAAVAASAFGCGRRTPPREHRLLGQTGAARGCRRRQRGEGRRGGPREGRGAAS